MFGVIIFQNLYFNLSEKYRNKILGNIFGVFNVSITDFIVREDSVIFRIFSGGVFYQYIFDFRSVNDRPFIEVSGGRDIIIYFISVKLWINTSHFSSIDLLIKIFMCQDEYLIYQLMKMLL